MQYFEQDYIDFFKELGANNNKDWFHANKKRYEEKVKIPFKNFVTDLITSVQQFEPEMEAEAKNCISRINRDIRFAKDKTPYHTHFTGFVTHGGKKNKDTPGLFIRFAPDSLAIMGGCYKPSTAQLAKIRNRIAKDPKGFQKLIYEPNFKKTFGSLRGEQSKRVAKEIQTAAEIEPLIMNKQFYYVDELDSKLLTSKNLMKEIMKRWEIARPVKDYLTNCIN